MTTLMQKLMSHAAKINQTCVSLSKYQHVIGSFRRQVVQFLIEIAQTNQRVNQSLTL